MNNVEVTVCCLAYNHEKYIRKTIDSILMQKTTFRYEVLINDDCSTDKTTSIIQEYEKNYPEIIKGIYHDTNQHSKGIRSFPALVKRANGKYIATCDCDDYWSDEYKLQKQYDLMENNKQCVFCSHKVRHIEEDGTLKNVWQPVMLEEGIYMGEDIIRMMLDNKGVSLFHFSSYFFVRNAAEELVTDMPDFYSKAPVADLFLQLYFATKGNVAFIDEEMSHYRRNSIGSWTNRHKNRDAMVSHLRRLSDSYSEFDKYTGYKYHELIDSYIKSILFRINLTNNDYKEIKKDPENFGVLKTMTKVRCFVCCYFPLASRIYWFLKAHRSV